MVSSGIKFVKFSLFFFNMLLFLAGLIFIIAGAVIQAKFNDYFAFFGSKLNAVAIVLAVVGIIVLAIGFFGCCGAYRESYCMIITFTVILALVLILEISAAAVTYVMKNEVHTFLGDNMKLTINKYDPENHKGVSIAWDTAQKQFSCCGITNYTDWKENTILKNSVPDSCCFKYSDHCGANVITSNNVTNIHQKGCLNGIMDWSMENYSIIVGVDAALIFFQIIGIALACCLASSLKHQYETV